MNVFGIGVVKNLELLLILLFSLFFFKLEIVLILKNGKFGIGIIKCIFGFVELF